eukprot:CAMPEP_0195015430 /NCGR_PEP_ID=MMETSP0326_2-20130528/19639_1 /TAXON_ID=2866 ORGANISM="Crypthecodinium cohnii, Strain Seligo" /NCGR_SAMPLE_ID=MMETSP0326_2 /ASSEMBLY_ACC=CAM_ASM_000348 /LENGTH=53 /DNA_ID=CAMNT_0040029689 /DNA_START=64 /DNA_END=223 /DNA_ORIENTATION=+
MTIDNGELVLEATQKEVSPTQTVSAGEAVIDIHKGTEQVDSRQVGGLGEDAAN